MDFELKSISVGDLGWLVAQRLAPCLVVGILDATPSASPKTETEVKIDRKLAAFGLKRCQFKLSILPHNKIMTVPDFSVIPFHFTTDIIPGSEPEYNRSLIQAMHIAMTWATPDSLENSNVGDQQELPVRQDSGFDLEKDGNRDLIKLPLGMINKDDNVGERDLARSAEPNQDETPRPKLPKLPKFESLDAPSEENTDFKLAPINLPTKDSTNLPKYPPEPLVSINYEPVAWTKPLKIISPAVKSSLYNHATIPQHLIDPNLLKDLPPNGTLNLTGYFNTMGISHQINPEIRFHDRQEKVVKGTPPPPFPKSIPLTKARIGAQIVHIGDWIELSKSVIKLEKITVPQGQLTFHGTNLNGKREKANLSSIKGRFDPVFENVNGHVIVEECNWDFSRIQTVERTVNLSD